MGYDTRHKLSVYPETYYSKLYKYIYNVLGHWPFDDPRPWPELDKDLADFSHAWPHVIFVVDGEGEEAGDIWRKVWFNGELQLSWQASIDKPAIPKELIEEANLKQKEAKEKKIKDLEKEIELLKKEIENGVL